MANQTAFYSSYVEIGGANYPVLGNGARLSAPANWAIPPIIGNLWQVNYGAGLVSPVVDVNFAVRDKASEVLATAFLNTFLTRSADAANDTSILSGGIVFWNGRSGFTLNNAKADSFVLSCSGKGADLNLSARFLGTSITALGAVPAGAPYGSAPIIWDKSPLLRFASVSFGGALANVVWSFSLSFSNNSNPDLALDGTTGPSNINAGLQTCGLQYTVQAATTSVIDNGLLPPPSSPTALTIVITGANITRTFSLSNPIDATPNELTTNVPRVMRSHQVIALGLPDGATGPLVIS